MFIVALFSVARRRKQPKNLSADKWMNNVWYIQCIVKEGNPDMIWVNFGRYLLSENAHKRADSV